MDTASNQDWRPLLDAMVERLKERGTLRDARVEDALRAVPRHEFLLRDSDPEEAYTGDVIRVLASADGGTLSTISDVRSVVGLLQMLDLRAGENALEIGLGTGYNAALMAHLVSPGSVTSIDSEEVLVRGASETLHRLGIDNVRPLARDGWLGDSPSSPFDAILATVGVSDISPHWAAQLRDGGRVLLPLFVSVTVQPGVLFEKQGERFLGRALGTQRYVMLKGRGHDDLGDWVIVNDDFWTLPRASREAWQVLTRLLSEPPAIEESFPVEDAGWPSWPSWLGLEDPNVVQSVKGLTGLFDIEAGGLAVVDPSDRTARSYGDPVTYERLVELVLRQRPTSQKSLVGRMMSDLTIEAVPHGSGVQPTDGWLFRRENYDFMVRLAAQES
jgi:protein-L-isoaspartate(D-aspartate) O-methyltransferase